MAVLMAYVIWCPALPAILLMWRKQWPRGKALKSRPALKKSMSLSFIDFPVTKFEFPTWRLRKL